MSTTYSISLIPTLAAASGGALGAAARYQIGLVMARCAGPETQIPWGTFTVNITGSLIMGAMLGWFARGGVSDESIRVFMIAGLMGGFTTFSAFSAEMVTMLFRGHILIAAGYAAASVIIGMLAFAAGLIAAQSV